MSEQGIRISEIARHLNMAYWDVKDVLKGYW